RFGFRRRRSHQHSPGSATAINQGKTSARNPCVDKPCADKPCADKPRADKPRADKTRVEAGDSPAPPSTQLPRTPDQDSTPIIDTTPFRVASSRRSYNRPTNILLIVKRIGLGPDPRQ